MLKTNFVQSIKELVTNRYLTTLSIVLILLTAAFVVYIALTVHPSDLQLVTHYTAFGVTHLYRDQWFYLLSFIGFAVLSTFLHISIAIKLYVTKGHPLAIMFAWFGIGVILFAWITAISIINVWSPV
jgi:Zn-dependent protease